MNIAKAAEEKAAAIAATAVGATHAEAAKRFGLARQTVGSIIAQVREDDIKAYQRYCALARWSALTAIGSAIEEIAATFTPEMIAKIKGPVQRGKVLANLARARRDLLDSKAYTEGAGAPKEEMSINLFPSIETWNEYHARINMNKPASVPHNGTQETPAPHAPPENV